MRAMLIAAGFLAPVPLAAQQPYGTSPREAFPRGHPADAARRDLDMPSWQSQPDADRPRQDAWRDMQRQQDQRTPLGRFPEGPPPRPSPWPGAR